MSSTGGGLKDSQSRCRNMPTPKKPNTSTRKERNPPRTWKNQEGDESNMDDDDKLNEQSEEEQKPTYRTAYYESIQSLDTSRNVLDSVLERLDAFERRTSCVVSTDSETIPDVVQNVVADDVDILVDTGDDDFPITCSTDTSALLPAESTLTSRYYKSLRTVNISDDEKDENEDRAITIESYSDRNTDSFHLQSDGNGVVSRDPRCTGTQGTQHGNGSVESPRGSNRSISKATPTSSSLYPSRSRRKLEVNTAMANLEAMEAHATDGLYSDTSCFSATSVASDDSVISELPSKLRYRSNYYSSLQSKSKANSIASIESNAQNTKRKTPRHSYSDCEKPHDDNQVRDPPRSAKGTYYSSYYSTLTSPNKPSDAIGTPTQVPIQAFNSSKKQLRKRRALNRSPRSRTSDSLTHAFEEGVFGESQNEVTPTRSMVDEKTSLQAIGYVHDDINGIPASCDRSLDSCGVADSNNSQGRSTVHSAQMNQDEMSEISTVTRDRQFALGRKVESRGIRDDRNKSQSLGTMEGDAVITSPPILASSEWPVSRQGSQKIEMSLVRGHPDSLVQDAASVPFRTTSQESLPKEVERDVQVFTSENSDSVSINATETYNVNEIKSDAICSFTSAVTSEDAVVSELPSKLPYRSNYYSSLQAKSKMNTTNSDNSVHSPKRKAVRYSGNYDGAYDESHDDNIPSSRPSSTKGSYYSSYYSTVKSPNQRSDEIGTATQVPIKSNKKRGPRKRGLLERSPGSETSGSHMQAIEEFNDGGDRNEDSNATTTVDDSTSAAKTGSNNSVGFVPKVTIPKSPLKSGSKYCDRIADGISNTNTSLGLSTVFIACMDYDEMSEISNVSSHRHEPAWQRNRENMTTNVTPDKTQLRVKNEASPYKEYGGSDEVMTPPSTLASNEMPLSTGCNLETGVPLMPAKALADRLTDDSSAFRTASQESLPPKEVEQDSIEQTCKGDNSAAVPLETMHTMDGVKTDSSCFHTSGVASDSTVVFELSSKPPYRSSYYSSLQAKSKTNIASNENSAYSPKRKGVGYSNNDGNYDEPIDNGANSRQSSGKGSCYSSYYSTVKSPKKTGGAIGTVTQVPSQTFKSKKRQSPRNARALIRSPGSKTSGSRMQVIEENGRGGGRNGGTNAASGANETSPTQGVGLHNNSIAFATSSQNVGSTDCWPDCHTSLGLSTVFVTRMDQDEMSEISNVSSQRHEISLEQKVESMHVNDTPDKSKSAAENNACLGKQENRDNDTVITSPSTVGSSEGPITMDGAREPYAPLAETMMTNPDGVNEDPSKVLTYETVHEIHPLMDDDDKAWGMHEYMYDNVGYTTFTKDVYLLREPIQNLSLPASADEDDGNGDPPCFLLGMVRRRKEEECNVCVIS